MTIRHLGLAIAAVGVVATLAVLIYLQNPAGRPMKRANSPNGTVQQSQEDTTNDQSTATAGEPDVVVVGAGISGLSAAVELGRSGAQVVVVDMSSVFGGHAVMSQGGVSIIDTPVQRAAGVNDSPDLAYRDFITWGEDADADWVRYYVDHSRREIYDWLIELGVQFDGIDTAPGNSVDRFHQPTDRGIGLVTPIYRECLEHDNVSFVWNAQAVKLLNENGRVVGIVTRDTRTQDEREIRCGAVVLATGGFQSNLDMVREFWPQEFRFPQRILAGSGRNSIGLGHRLAQKVGGDLVKMDHQWNYFTGIPDPRYQDSNRGLSAANMHGIIVNPKGNRFANLHNWAKEVMPKMLAQERVTLWFVFDEATKPEFVISGTDWADFDKVDRLVLQNRTLVQSADTIEELARKSGLPPENLTATIDRYNALVKSGTDTDFDRFGPSRPAYSNKSSPMLDTPPYYAMQAYPLTRKSMGGVAIDLSCRVVDKQQRPIPGLYAVGELTGLAGINGKAALEGTFLGPCIITGRVAARAILKESNMAAAKRVETEGRCISCHDVKSLIDEPRPGYWHFEKVHGRVLELGTDCRQCHAEMSPYRKENHHINDQVLTAACVRCHVAQE